MRISFDALRLCLLVAAGVTSGYLWRAAFESSSPVEARIAANPRIIENAPPPVVRIVPHHLTRTPRRTVATPVVRGVVQEPTPARVIVAAPHVQASPPPVGTPASPPQKPTPTPAPQPTPPPSTTPTPPSQSPPPVSSPVQQVASPPPAAPPTTTTTPTPPANSADDGSRPGWGNGDKNHDHSGPGGKKP